MRCSTNTFTHVSLDAFGPKPVSLVLLLLQVGSPDGCQTNQDHSRPSTFLSPVFHILLLGQGPFASAFNALGNYCTDARYFSATVSDAQTAPIVNLNRKTSVFRERWRGVENVKLALVSTLYCVPACLEGVFCIHRP